MKKLLLAFLFVSFGVFAQGTTQKEFNYLSKGYKDDLEMGKDIIQGYSIELLSSNVTITIENNKNVKRETSIYKFTRVESEKIAAFLIIDKRFDNGAITYICLPNASSDQNIWTQSRDMFFEKSKDFKCDNVGGAFSYSWNYLMILSKLSSN